MRWITIASFDVANHGMGDAFERANVKLVEELVLRVTITDTTNPVLYGFDPLTGLWNYDFMLTQGLSRHHAGMFGLVEGLQPIALLRGIGGSVGVEQQIVSG